MIVGFVGCKGFEKACRPVHSWVVYELAGFVSGDYNFAMGLLDWTNMP